jgi:hypothetical protein
MLMSLMSSISSMMKGSGLEEALETVNGPNAVAHMILCLGHCVEAALVNNVGRGIQDKLVPVSDIAETDQVGGALSQL